MNKHPLTRSAIALATLSLVGCATYKSSDAGMSKIGYKETPLSDNVYKLTYYGSAMSTHDKIIELWHRRAAELCQQKPYEAETKNEQWLFDSYSILPPIVLKSESSAPAIVGKLTCQK